MIGNYWIECLWFKGKENGEKFKELFKHPTIYIFQSLVTVLPTNKDLDM